MIEIPRQLQKRGINFVLLEKGGKKPFQKEWTTKKIEYDSKELHDHLLNNGNYGVMGGGENKLVIIDFDNSEVQAECLRKLPKTFTVMTGSGMLHLYYLSNNSESFKIFDEDMNTLSDIQGDGKQVVGPGSIHPNGTPYQVIEDIEISFLDYSELKAIMMPLDKKPRKEKKEIKQDYHGHIEDSFLTAIKSKLHMEEVLRWMKIDTSINPTQCPFHGSKGGKCLGFEKETAHCFHCEGAWNIFSLIMEYKKCSFKEALDILAGIAGMEKDLEDSRKKYLERLKIKNLEEYDSIRRAFIELISGKDKKWGEASELLTNFIQQKLWLYTTKDDVKNETWVYRDGIYVPNGKSEIKELMRNILKDFYSQYIYGLVMTKIEADTFIDLDKFFKTSYPGEIAVLNGILNIKTRKLSEFNPEKIFFNKMPVNYNPDAKCPQIEQFFSDVLRKKEDSRIMFEIAGFGLLDEYKFEKAFMFHGDGRNGKGKSIELLKRLFGLDNCCAVHLSSLKTENFSISELFGKRMNLAGDIGSNDLKETEMFKSLTGRDLISAKRKFLRDIHFENYAKFVFACNELPMVYDTKKGFWDRWILLDFPYTFVTKEEYDLAIDRTMLKIKDDSIIDKISTPEELSGFLNKALDALDDLEKNKKFSTTIGSEEVKTIWIRRSNSAIAFCWDYIEDDYSGRVTKKDFRKKYIEYCKTHKIKALSDFMVKKILQENYGIQEVQGRDDFGGRLDYWEGIKWK